MVKPQSKWTVLVAIVLAVILHLVPVAIVEMKDNTPPVETNQALSSNAVSAKTD